MVEKTTPIAELNNFIVLDRYESAWERATSYQSEDDLERELIQDLIHQGYEFLPHLTTPEAMLANVREQLQILNKVRFSEAEWLRFAETYLDRPNDDRLDKTRKLHDDYIHDFVFDNGLIQNIYLLDKNKIARNKVQVIRQFEQTGKHKNRYDVTILVNGLPLVQIELKRRGVALEQAFNQIHRYSKESFNEAHSLYKYVQLFVISNGTDTRYFSNTTKRDKNHFDFTINWARADNSLIKDLKDFTATFLQKHVLLHVLLTYCVFDTQNNLLVMRPYQIAATERILWKIKNIFETQNWRKAARGSLPENGGYIWHTTGSGKTLTSFKAARLATQLDFIDKVFFVVDRKDLDDQTMREYLRFSPDSVNGSNSTAGLKRNLDKDDNRIIVTTIQKLNNLMKSEKDLNIYHKQVVFIFDECHRSQFGEAQQNLKKKFKKFCQFGFTGTPIWEKNAYGEQTTEKVFGSRLHSYIITDAIRDEKVLKFKVDYNDVRPKFKQIEEEKDEKKLKEAEKAFLHPERIREISRYILSNFHHKTHRLQGGNEGFNAMFAVSSIDAAKLYYETLNALQGTSEKKLKIATIFSFAANEAQNPLGAVPDETFDVSAMNSSAKEFLQAAIQDYNRLFKTSYSLDGNGFHNYYRDLGTRIKAREVDLVIVVGMFLTGFDAPRLNTLFVDKNLAYHGLIQAYSRTNRILGKTKDFGNIVTFRDLEQATIEAIILFGDENTKHVMLERSYQEYMEGFKDIVKGEVRRGFKVLVKDLEQRFPDPMKIETEADKKEFVKLFGDYLRAENILQNYDEYTSLQAWQDIDASDAQAVAAFKAAHHLDDAALAAMKTVKLLTPRQIQDYKSSYHDIRQWLRHQKAGDERENATVNWDDVVFEVDLLKSQEINLDYILEQVFEKNKKIKDKAALIEDVRRIIRASLDNRAKEGLMIDFISQTNLDAIGDKASLIEAFYKFAQEAQKREAEALIAAEELKPQETKRYLMASIKQEFASDDGNGLNSVLPDLGPFDKGYFGKKRTVFQKITEFVEKFKGVGGKI